MKTRNQYFFRALLLCGALSLTLPQAVLAVGTPACTTINNQASLAYSVGGVGQTGINSTIASFPVGNKIVVTVTNQDAAAKVVIPGSTNQQLTYRITNLGNADQRYKLTLTNGQAGNPAELSGVAVYATTDNFDATTPGIGATGVNTVTTAVVTPGNFLDYTINADIAAARVNNDAAAYGLIAQAYKVDGATVETESASASATSSAGTCNTAIVFGDTTDGTDDGTGRNGTDSARGIYKVVTSNLSFAKVATTYWDPINGNSSPKAIPGALIKYTVTVTNAAGSGSSASLTTITDTLSGTLAIDPDLKVAAACGAPPCLLTSLANENAAGNGFKITSGGLSTRASVSTPAYFATATYYTAPTITAAMGTMLPVEAGPPAYTAGELKPGDTVTLTFNVVVQ